MTFFKRLVIATATATAIGGGAAFAAGTTAGVTITNTATVGYTVGGVVQPDVSSNSASFVVDELVNMSVAQSGGAVTVVVPGATTQVAVFTVTNTSNATLDFRLVASQDATGATTAFSGTDAGDVTNLKVYVDSNGNGVYDVGVDTATYIDQLAADATKTVFLVADVPFGIANGAYLGVNLTAIAAAGTSAGSLGSDLVATVGADTPGSVDIVFGDAAGRIDAVGDGKYSDGGAFRISTAALTISKTAKVISDPINGTNNPKPVPGAIVEYCIIVQNSGAVPAANVLITDVLPLTTTFVTSTIKVGGTVTAGACNADGAAGGAFAAGVVTATITTVSAGQSVTALFRTKIN